MLGNVLSIIFDKDKDSESLLGFKSVGTNNEVKLINDIEYDNQV